MAPCYGWRGPSTGTLGTNNHTTSGGADEALVYHGPGRRGGDTVPGPTIIDPTDVVVRIDSSTICGTDLRIPRRRA